MRIKEIVNLNPGNITGINIIDALEEVLLDKNIFVIKADGLRNDNTYTVFISSGDNSFETIRSDSSNLNIAIHNVLIEYSNRA